MLPRPNKSAEKCIADPDAYFRDLGHLHDAEIMVIEVDLVKHEVLLVVDDLYANFLGLPEYEGLQSVRLTLEDVAELDVGITFDSLPVRIMDFEVRNVSSSPQLQVMVRFWPSGSIVLSCSSIACRPT